MYKKILLAGIFALGLSGVVTAENFDNEADYNDEPSTELDGAAYARPGIYFGGLAGVTNLHYDGSSYTTPNSSYVDHYKFAARGYVGYAFSQFISLELGYDYFGKPKFKATDNNTQEITQQGIDMLVKANLPLDYGFSVYAKGGMAWVHRSALNPTGTNNFANKEANGTFAPMAALGINYWFAPNIAVDFCWTKTMTISDLPTIDFFGAGIIYKINL